MNWTRLLRLAAIATLLVSLVTIVDTQQHFIELFAHFRPQYLAVAGLLSVFFAVRRAPVYAIASLMAAVINAGFMLPWYQGVTAAPAGDPLKFVYANVLSSNDDYGRLLDLIDQEQPDFIFLQEFSPQWQAATESLNTAYPASYLRPRQDHFGIAMFSRLPLSSVTHINSPPLGYPTLVATVDINGTELTLLSSHPTIPVGRERFAARNAQLQSLVDVVRQVNGPVVLLGDLNASVFDRHYQQLETLAGLSNVRRGFGLLPTWPTFLPLAMIPIDHVLVSDELDVIEARTGARIGSDHLPLVVTVVSSF